MGFVPTGDLSALSRIAILGVLLVLLLLSRSSMAETALDDAAGEAPKPAAVVAVPEILPPDSVSILSLLAIPADRRSPAEIADESIAAAVRQGTNPDLKPLNPFRKRKTDLFRAERPVEIGDQEMLLRLRLRAKRREQMSVELRF